MPAIQYWFTGSALATFITLLAAVSTLGYSWYRAAITELESTTNKTKTATQTAKTERVKALLGTTLASGNKLISQQKDEDDDRAERDANAWGEQTHSLIAAAFGDGEAALFLDSSGYVFYGDGSAKKQYTKLGRWPHEAHHRTSAPHRLVDGQK